MVGRSFGRLTVLARVPSKGVHALFACRCACGRDVEALGHHLRSGHTASCGCLRAEKASAWCASRTAHGHARRAKPSPEYRVWAGMLNRCTNPSNDSWSRYGGRGIRVCQRWLASFEAFLKDVGPRPSLRHSLDRFPNNDGNYEPGNVRWATARQQCANMSTNRVIEWDGKKLTVQEWSRLTGIDATTIGWRLKRGWGPPRIFSPPRALRPSSSRPRRTGRPSEVARSRPGVRASAKRGTPARG